MDQIQIRLLGGMQVRWRDRPVSLPTRQSRSLLAFLVLNPDRAFHRDVICGEFWGERTDSEARKALRMALWRIRSALKPCNEEIGFLKVSSTEIRFLESEATWVDVLEFQRRVKADEIAPAEPLPSHAASSLIRAVDLYKGDLLDGVYDEWCVVERERVRLLYLRALERLVGHYQRKGEWRLALAQAKQILKLDPLREDVHRQVMRCYHAMGSRPSAIRQFRECEVVLREELDLSPMEQTTTLYRRIKEGEPISTEVPSSRKTEGVERPEPGVAAEINQLAATTRRLERIVEQLVDREHGPRPGGGPTALGQGG